MIPEEYWSHVQLLTTEIEDAIIIHYTYEEINGLALRDEAILNGLNRDSLLWKTQMYCLQTSLFITLSRIFDYADQASTIHKLINSTIGNLPLFSKSALAVRNARGDRQPDAFGAWVPASAEDLRHLKRALKPHSRRFKQVYEPIRHAMFAHRLMSNADAGATLFQDTDREEISAMLDFLHDLIYAISNLYLNGRKPELGTRSYKDHNQRIRDGVSAVLKPRLLEQNGWIEMRSKGSHRHFKHPQQASVITVPCNQGKELATGTLNAILQKSRSEINMRRYPAIIEQKGTGYSAYSPDIPGCAASGDTQEETRSNFQEALAAHFEAMREIGETIPEPHSSVDYVEVAA